MRWRPVSFACNHKLERCCPSELAVWVKRTLRVFLLSNELPNIAKFRGFESASMSCWPAHWWSTLSRKMTSESQVHDSVVHVNSRRGHTLQWFLLQCLLQIQYLVRSDLLIAHTSWAPLSFQNPKAGHRRTVSFLHVILSNFFMERLAYAPVTSGGIEVTCVTVVTRLVLHDVQHRPFRFGLQLQCNLTGSHRISPGSKMAWERETQRFGTSGNYRCRLVPLN